MKEPKNSVKMTNKELRAFAMMMAWAFPLFIGVIAPFILGVKLQWWTLFISLFFVLLAWLSPQLIYYPYRGWMFIGGIIGFINTRIILGVTFFFLIFPTGLVLRLTNKLQYKSYLASENEQQSNYIQRTDKIDKKQLENPF